MKYKIRTSAMFMSICMVSLSLAAAVSAGNGRAAQKEQTVIALWSKTDMHTGADAELAAVYREADARLMDQVSEGLAKRGMKVAIVQSEEDIAAGPARYVLLLKLDRIELGGKRPFGRTARVKVAYTVQNKDRFALIKRTHEETSASKWQNCVKKIGEQLVVDVNDDVMRNSVSQKATGRQEARKQAPAPSSSEERLLQLENLKVKGLISQEEYATKRKEMLKEL